MSQQFSFLKYQLPAVVWTLTIFGLSALPRIPVPISSLGIDKLLHAAVYAMLCVLSWRALWFQSRVELFRRHAILFAFLFSFVYGALNELYQMYLPDRSPDIGDALANGTGTLVSVFFLLWRQKKRAHSSRI